MWAGKVSEEFASQLELEKQLGLPVSTFMQAPKPQLELNFIEFVVLPLWKTVAQAFPVFEARVTQMLQNHEQWGVLQRQAVAPPPAATPADKPAPSEDAKAAAATFGKKAEALAAAASAPPAPAPSTSDVVVDVSSRPPAPAASTSDVVVEVDVIPASSKG